MMPVVLVVLVIFAIMVGIMYLDDSRPWSFIFFPIMLSIVPIGLLIYGIVNNDPVIVFGAFVAIVFFVEFIKNDLWDYILDEFIGR